MDSNIIEQLSLQVAGKSLHYVYNLPLNYSIEAVLFWSGRRHL
jgi:hypothetical protein